MVLWSPMSEYLIHFDGSISKNPGGIAAYGYTIKKDGLFWKEGSECLGAGAFSNNYAELYGAYKGLEVVYRDAKEGDKVFVRGDSQLAIYLLQKRYRASSEKLYYPAFKLAETQTRALRNLKCPVDFSWVPREMNKEADKLSKWNNQEVPIKDTNTTDLLRNERYFKQYLDNRD